MFTVFHFAVVQSTKLPFKNALQIYVMCLCNLKSCALIIALFILTLPTLYRDTYGGNIDFTTYINLSDVANIYVDNIGIYVQMKRAYMSPILATCPCLHVVQR